MFVALVQGIVRALNENPSPFDESGSEKTSHHADDDFLSERRMH